MTALRLGRAEGDRRSVSLRAQVVLRHLGGERILLREQDAFRSRRDRTAPWPSGFKRSSTASAPNLSPRLCYGMPAYAKDGNVVCQVQTAQKFKMRYATLGFSDKAHLDDGTLWPVAFAPTELTATDEATIAALVKKAAS